MATQLEQVLSNLQQQIHGANRMAREALERSTRSSSALGAVQANLQDQSSQQAEEVAKLKGVIEGMKITGSAGVAGRPDMLTIEQIPGRRVPFDVTVQVAVPANLTSSVTGTYTLSMDGPFVAVARYATFISTYTFQVSDGQNVTRYVGRSFGRQRPISSVTDLMDAMTGWNEAGIFNLQTQQGCGAEETAPEPVVLARPTNKSPYRTMGFDGYVSLKNSIYPRQNQQVPTSLWAPGFTQTQQLPVLDYFEKGEIIEFEIEPLHVNNPAAGNIQSFLGSMPYLAGQYDGHEGIGYTDWVCDPGVSDVITRRPDGILVVGLLGFRILQPSGVRMR